MFKNNSASIDIVLSNVLSRTLSGLLLQQDVKKVDNCMVRHVACMLQGTDTLLIAVASLVINHSPKGAMPHFRCPGVRFAYVG